MTEPITISPITSLSDFSSVGYIEKAAFSGGFLDSLMFGPSDNPSLCSSRHISYFLHDSSALYTKACLPSGKIIGFGKWNFFPSSGPQHPWNLTKGEEGSERHFVGSREMYDWFFGQEDRERNERLGGVKHVLMAILAIDPEFQRRGAGKKLLEWGLERVDREELVCWIDATPEGKGLYEKLGWKVLTTHEIDFKRWGGGDERAVNVGMVRGVGGREWTERGK